MPIGMRKHLLPPLVLLLLCSFVILAVVHFQLRPVGDALIALESRSVAAGLVGHGERAAIAAFKAKLFWAEVLLTVAAVAAVACSSATVILAVRSIAQPVAHLVEVARTITRGRARLRASPEIAGDFRILAEAFNQMIDARQQAEEKLQLAHDSLELKVQARTIELWRANKALQEESEQRGRAEREFQQAQKMDALGKLAGSIAHDFNNLLTVIIGGAECAREQLPAEHPAVPLLRTVQQAGERAAGLTRPLLTFSRNQVLALEPLSLNDAAEEAAGMLQRLIGVNVEVRMTLDPKLRLVKANANQLQQVLINLGVNARDAMDGIGVLTIATREAVVTSSAAVRHGVPCAEYWVELAVSDTGCGMDATTKARIFEPFFTTKEPGRGTGLGLATVFGIIKQMGGFLDVESAPGHGTTFRIVLPATEELELPTVSGVDPAPRSETKGGETLLLVDDEEDIRELAIITLESRGYRVLAAASGDEALVVAEKHAADIRVLITDVVMPGMNGVQLADIASRIIPGLKVLFVSGHSNEAISDETLRATNGDYLQKPYLGEALAAKIRAVLDRRDFLPANGRACASGRAQNGHDTMRPQSAPRNGGLAGVAQR